MRFSMVRTDSRAVVVRAIMLWFSSALTRDSKIEFGFIQKE